MVLNQKCQNKVKSYLCSSASASAEQKEEKRPDTQEGKQLSEYACVPVCMRVYRMLNALHPTPQSVGVKVVSPKEPNRIFLLSPVRM